MPDDFPIRPVLFTRDATRALEFYRDTLGFGVHWIHEQNGQPFVFMASLFGMRVILNQTESDTEDRPGKGRVFVGLDEAKAERFLRHVRERGIATSTTQWGAPTTVIKDLDGNEFFVWLPPGA